MSAATSASRFALLSKSKIPPELGGAPREIFDACVDGVDALGFHVRDRQLERTSIPQAPLPLSAD
jgi:hypothetical protein